MLKRYLALFQALNAARVKYLVISLDDLIQLKRAAGRIGDLEDVALLEKIRSGKI